MWHQFKDAWNGDGNILVYHKDEDFMSSFMAEEPQIFVVDHHWGDVFKNAGDYSAGEYRLPYERCCFNFLVGPKHVLVLAHQTEAGPEISTWAAHGDTWVGFRPSTAGDMDDLYATVSSHIRAACIALDAEVAYTEVVREPSKLNRSRAKVGRSPIPAYNVVKLCHRTRAAPVDSEPTGQRKRLHFRRGHWRHFEAHKTWIKWTLVGDPDMAFVDKYYRV